MKGWRRLLAMLLAVCMLPAAVFAHPFSDVPDGEWYDPYVEYVYENSLMNGTSADSFGPALTMNRAMVVTVLYRMAGSPDVGAAAPFADVERGSFYEKAVAWAYEKGIVMGVSATEFAPGADVLRCQLVTFFYRYAKAMGHDTSARADLSGYRDRGDIMPFASDAFSWSVAEGIISGMSADTLGPNGTANRAQCAVILFRIDRLLKGETGSWLMLKDFELVLPVGCSRQAEWYYVGQGSLRWETSDPAVATVADGTITTVGEGTAEITVTDGTKKATATVTVMEYDLSMAENEITMRVGATYTMEVTYTGVNNLTWKHSHEGKIVTVSQNGEITAVAEGTAYITVTDGVKNATCKVIVEAAPTLTVNVTEATMNVGSTYQVNYTYTGDKADLTWRSRNESVATVDGNGVVTAVAAGNAKIVVSDGNTSKQCTIKVVQGQVMAEEIVIGYTDGPFDNGVTRYKGDYVVVTAINKPNDAVRDIVATSSNNDIVAVSATTVNGNSRDITLTFKAAGTATITLTSGDGAVSQSYTITVKDGYDFDPGDRQLTPEEFADYTTKVMCANGFTYDSTCTSWREFTRSADQLNFDQAVVEAYSMVHSWWPNGKRRCQIVYIGQNENGDYVFHECWG